MVVVPYTLVMRCGFCIDVFSFFFFSFLSLFKPTHDYTIRYGLDQSRRYKNVVRVPFFYDTEKKKRKKGPLSLVRVSRQEQCDPAGRGIESASLDLCRKAESKVKFLPLDYLYSLLWIDIACNVSEFIGLLSTFPRPIQWKSIENYFDSFFSTIQKLSN